MFDRMVRASRFDPAAYESVEHDAAATGQIVFVVAVAALASGVGLWRTAGLLGLCGGVVVVVIDWIVWSAITYWVGKGMFATSQTEVTLGQMVRTLGLAQSPQVLNVLGFIPVLGPLLRIVTTLWTLLAGIIAIRQAMDFSTVRAVGTAVVGYIFVVILLVLFVLPLLTQPAT